MIDKIASDDVLECGFSWLCEQRKDATANCDVWDLRLRWGKIKSQLQCVLRQGTYTFSPVKQYHINGEWISCWSSKDALVLKAMAIVLTEQLEPHLSSRCFHIKDHGGLKAAVTDVKSHFNEFPFFLRSDVKSYYASMDHNILMGLCKEYIADPLVLKLLDQYMHHLVDVDANLIAVEQGISLGCSLSPLIGGLYLKPLDVPWQLAMCITHDTWTIGAYKRKHVGI
jgi:RNA-directed DNA polymerase